MVSVWRQLSRAVLRFGAGGHPKAAAASVRLTSDDPETEARMLIDDLVETICEEQVGVGGHPLARVLVAILMIILGCPQYIYMYEYNIDRSLCRGL